MEGGEPERWRTVASYSSYEAARRAMEGLPYESFPVERVFVVADGVKCEEETERLDYARTALLGTGIGEVLGVAIVVALGLLGLTGSLASVPMLAAGGLLFGALAGAAIGCGLRAVFRGGRGATCVACFRQACRYRVVADEEVASGALRRISERNRSPLDGETHDGGSAQPALPELATGKAETIPELEPSEEWEQR